MAAIKVIGIGNPYRHDDAAGLEAVRRIRALGLTRIEVEEATGEGADLMDRWAGSEHVILIDAVRSGAAPGTLHRLDASAQTVPKRFFSYSTHAFSVAEAVELSRRLGRLPSHLVIFGIEGGDFSTGPGLTFAVEKAVENVARAVQEIAARRTGS